MAVVSQRRVASGTPGSAGDQSVVTKSASWATLRHSTISMTSP